MEMEIVYLSTKPMWLYSTGPTALRDFRTTSYLVVQLKFVCMWIQSNVQQIVKPQRKQLSQWGRLREWKKIIFCLQEVTEDYILKLINDLGPSNSTGLDGLPARFIKDRARILKRPITHTIYSLLLLISLSSSLLLL